MEADQEPDLFEPHTGGRVREHPSRGVVCRPGHGGHHDLRPGQGFDPRGAQAVGPAEVERAGKPAEQHEDAELEDDERQRRADAPEARPAPAKTTPVPRDAGTVLHAVSPHHARRQGCLRAHFRAVEYAGWLVRAPVGRLVGALPRWPVGTPVGAPVRWVVGAAVWWSVPAWPGWAMDAQ